MMHRQPWTDAERRLAAECESLADFARVAAQLRRTPAAVCRMRYTLRPAGRDHRPWKPHEDRILLAVPTYTTAMGDTRCPHGTLTAIARRLRRSVLSVKSRRVRLMGRKG